MTFLLSFILFLPLAVVLFTIPGNYILSASKVDFEPWEKLGMGTIIGFVLFSLVAYIFIVLNIPWLIIPASLIATVLGTKDFVSTLKALRLPTRSKLVILSLVFILGVAGQMAVIAPSGTTRNGDILFWSAHGHDGAWHIALMEEMKKGYPFVNPVFPPERLVNYHFFSDVAPAILSKYANFSNLDLYFRLFPFVFSVLLGVSAYYLTKRLTKNNFTASIWVVIFTYFAGSFGYIVTLIKDGRIAGESIFWATQPQSSSGNPPQIVSNFLVLAFLYFGYLILKKPNKILFFMSTLLIGTLAVFKVYGAVVLFAGIGVAGIWQLIRERRLQLIALTAVGAALAAILYLPNTANSTGFLIYEPWWYIRTMIVEPSRLNLLDIELRRQTYEYYRNWKWIIAIETSGFLVFFFGNLGMRFIGLWDLAKHKFRALKDNFSLILVLVIATSVIMPLLFLQRGVASNTSQFLQYFVLLMGILAGISTSYFLAKIKIIPLRWVLICIIIILSIPTQVGLLNEFYSRDAFTRISKEELEALTYIKENTDENDIILTPPYDQYFSAGGEIPHIWDWFDTSYVAALTSRRTYFDDYEQVDIMGYQFKERWEDKKKIFSTEKTEEFSALIRRTNATILYYPKVLKPAINPEDAGMAKIYANQLVEVWQVE